MTNEAIGKDIEIWDSQPALEVTSTLKKSKVRVFLEHLEFSKMPIEFMVDVEKQWNEFLKKSPNAKDNLIPYQHEYEQTGSTVEISLKIGGFRYQQVVNRTPENAELIPLANRLGILSCSTHAHLLSKDGQLLYATKKNQFNQISGFAGFPQISYAYTAATGLSCLNLYDAVKERLTLEIGKLSDKTERIQYVGLVFVGRQSEGLRGTDLDFLVNVDSEASEIIKEFEETNQHLKKLMPVDFTPEKMKEFITWANSDGRKMSPYAMGCMYNICKAFFGDKESKEIADRIISAGYEIEIDLPKINGNVFKARF